MKKKKFKIPLKNELAASVPLTNLFLLFYILGLNITSESNLSFVLSFFFTFFLSFFFVSFFGCFFLFYCGTQYMKPVLPPPPPPPHPHPPLKISNWIFLFIKFLSLPRARQKLTLTFKQVWGVRVWG